MNTESRELAVGGSVRDRMDYAKALAVSNLLPTAYRKHPENVLVAMEFGAALGIPPIQAINSIHVIEGKPTASADLIASLVRRAGHKLRIETGRDGDGPTVTATLIRVDDPEFAFAVTWTMAKARAAGLLGKGVWKQYPDQMLRNRAVTEVCRQGAGDALYSVIYTPEELGHDDPKAQTGQAVVDPQPDQEPESVASREQLQRVGELMAHLQMSGEQGLKVARHVTGRDLHSARELTPDEADSLIAELETHIDRHDDGEADGEEVAPDGDAE